MQRDSIIRMLNIIEARDIEERKLFKGEQLNFEVSLGNVDIVIITPPEFSKLMEGISKSEKISDIVFFNPVYSLDRKVLFSILGKMGTRVHTFKQ